MVITAVIEKLLPATGEPGPIVPAHEPGKRLLPSQRQPFQSFQKVPVK